MNRVEIHAVPKAAVATQLSRMRLDFAPAPPQSRFDFLVEGQLRLALRVAYPSASKRRVQVGGRCYTYVYHAWNFNFHHRGKVGDPYADFFACVPLNTEHELDLTRAFVIPWSSISGKTFYLPDSRRPYAGKFAVYRNAWSLITNAVAQREANARIADRADAHVI